MLPVDANESNIYEEITKTSNFFISCFSLYPSFPEFYDVMSITSSSTYYNMT